jgi:DNA-binding MarR family transcriptional regulator
METPSRTAADHQQVDGLEAWRGLIRTHSWIVRRVESALEAAHRLPLRGYEVLQQLAEQPNGRMRMRDLAEKVALTRSGLTRLVDRLEGEGLVERCSCAHDGRGAYACLTDQGRARLAQARATHLAVVQEHFLSRCTASELTTLTSLWSRILSAEPPRRPAGGLDPLRR